MPKIIFAVIVAVATQWVFEAPAQAAQTAREKCCVQMNGVWRAGRGGDMRCFSLARGAGDAYYKCVAAKGG
jgi:hypothetical protein